MEGDDVFPTVGIRSFPSAVICLIDKFLFKWFIYTQIQIQSNIDLIMGNNYCELSTDGEEESPK